MKLYCGTYKKYNEGSLFGKWLDLDDYADKDEFLDACRELHKDEEDPEFMFQDFESEYGWDEELYSECSIPDEYWDIHDELGRAHLDDEIYAAWLKLAYQKPSVDNIEKARDCYIGKFDSDAQCAETWCEEVGYISELKGSELITNNIDWNGVYQDLNFMDYDGYYFDMERC